MVFCAARRIIQTFGFEEILRSINRKLMAVLILRYMRVFSAIKLRHLEGESDAESHHVRILDLEVAAEPHTQPPVAFKTGGRVAEKRPTLQDLAPPS
jgi:hypothetical protein